MIYNLIKRFFDIVFSFIVLVILTPFFASVSLLLLFTGENEILYFQERIGHKNKKFKIFDMRNIYSASKMKEKKIKYFAIGC